MVTIERKADNHTSKKSENVSNEQNQEMSSNGNPTKISGDKAWGYDLYPERRGEKYSPKWTSVLFGISGTEHLDKIKCERNILWCIKESPMVKLMMGALKSSGCPIDIRRHISCEVCDVSVSGGYDPELNQVVVCQNVARNKGIVQGVLVHEMIHMFDYCNNNLDFKNVDHLACTEIRAANLTHCSFLSAWAQGDASPFKIKKAHQDCVKTKAMMSVLAVRNISNEDAIDAVERVFPQCYADLEPIGRRIRRNSTDMHRAYLEGPLYGYDI